MKRELTKIGDLSSNKGLFLSNTALMDKINHGLKTIKENGQYDKIYAKWFK